MTVTGGLLAGVIVLGYVFQLEWVGVQGKTLWNWLDLLIVPLVIAAGGIWFNWQQNNRQQQQEDQRRDREREVEERRAQDAGLQSYVDQMGTLLNQVAQIHAKLRDKYNVTVRPLARARTLTALEVVGPDYEVKIDSTGSRRVEPLRTRKYEILRFLREAKLIDKAGTAVPLLDANLSRAFLSKANFDGTNMSGANLVSAVMVETNLNDADLSEADLSVATLVLAKLARTNLTNAKLGSADLSLADLSDANLSGADLSNADLRGAVLDRVDLCHTTISDEQLDVCESFAGAYSSFS